MDFLSRYDNIDKSSGSLVFMKILLFLSDYLLSYITVSLNTSNKASLVEYWTTRLYSLV